MKVNVADAWCVRSRPTRRCGAGIDGGAAPVAYVPWWPAPLSGLPPQQLFGCGR